VVAEYLTQLVAAKYQPLLFSRSARESQTGAVAEAALPVWISVMPIWATPNYFNLIFGVWGSPDNSRFFHQPVHKS
jgi:hypothetical protein